MNKKKLNTITEIRIKDIKNMIYHFGKTHDFAVYFPENAEQIDNIKRKLQSYLKNLTRKQQKEYENT
jgi:hypothetical protein